MQYCRDYSYTGPGSPIGSDSDQYVLVLPTYNILFGIFLLFTFICQ